MISEFGVNEVIFNNFDKTNYYIDTIHFSTPIFNASGCWCINGEQIIELDNSKLGGIISKTCTLFSKEGNPEPNYYCDEINNLHFNCKGLPNNGYNYYRNMTNHVKKPYILSISYDDEDKLKTILNDYNLFVKNKSLIEINISCPNINNRIPGYHHEDIDKLCNFLRINSFSNLCFGLKLPPYFEIEFINDLAVALNKYTDIIKFITVSNSIPYSLPIYKGCNILHLLTFQTPIFI
jgi:dihydroorotate dehydrogenase (fumarate)